MGKITGSVVDPHYAAKANCLNRRSFPAGYTLNGHSYRCA